MLFDGFGPLWGPPVLVLFFFLAWEINFLLPFFLLPLGGSSVFFLTVPPSVQFPLISLLCFWVCTPPWSIWPSFLGRVYPMYHWTLFPPPSVPFLHLCLLVSPLLAPLRPTFFVHTSRFLGEDLAPPPFFAHVL